MRAVAPGLPQETTDICFAAGSGFTSFWFPHRSEELKSAVLTKKKAKGKKL